MNNPIIRLLALVVMCCAFVTCQKDKQTKVEPELEETDIIVNKNIPQNPSLSLKFEEDLSLTKEAWWPRGVTVDDEGNIYVYLIKENVICKFDSSGTEVYKKEFLRGRGPYEFFSIVPRYASDGRVFIYDQRQLRITIMNDNYEIQNILKFGGYRWVFKLDNQGNMYFWVVKFFQGTKDANRLLLSKFSPSGELIFEAFEYIYSIYAVEREKIEYKHMLFKPYGIYKLDLNDNLYYAISDNYEINIMTPDGTLVKRIKKDGKSRAAEKADIEGAMSIFPFASKPRSEIIIPDHMPYIADFFVLENKSLLVVTFENSYIKGTLAGDLFDESGIFQTRVEIPKYYGWFNLMGPIDSFACVKKDHFYTIEADEGEENFYVKRFKMIWE